MSVRATVTYNLTHGDGVDETVEIELSSDVSYSPDIASDLAARAKATLRDAIAETWPAPAAAP
jgi:hypothetical protein